MSRAFTLKQDSIPLLFSVGNRVMKAHPEYGAPKFVVVWYTDEDWAILCTANEATLIHASTIREFKRQEAGAQDRMNFLSNLWESADSSLKKPLMEVVNAIA